MPISDIDAGRLLEKMDLVHSAVSQLWGEIRELTKASMIAEERMHKGAAHFAVLDQKVEKLELLDTRVALVEERKCPVYAKPNNKWLVVAVTVGFMVLAFLTSFK